MLALLFALLALPLALSLSLFPSFPLSLLSLLNTTYNNLLSTHLTIISFQRLGAAEGSPSPPQI